MAENVPSEVEQFLAKHITSLDQLEVLLLVSALPDRAWSASAVYQVIMSTHALVCQRLDELVARGFLACSGEPPLYRYAPQSDELARQVAAVAGFYKMSRHRVVQLIYSAKSRPIDEFSKAFKFRREK